MKKCIISVITMSHITHISLPFYYSGAESVAAKSKLDPNAKEFVFTPVSVSLYHFSNGHLISKYTLISHNISQVEI